MAIHVRKEVISTELIHLDFSFIRLMLCLRRSPALPASHGFLACKSVGSTEQLACVFILGRIQDLHALPFNRAWNEAAMHGYWRKLRPDGRTHPNVWGSPRRHWALPRHLPLPNHLSLSLSPSMSTSNTEGLNWRLEVVWIGANKKYSQELAKAKFCRLLLIITLTPHVSHRRRK
jgi:hypothetical protein